MDKKVSIKARPCVVDFSFVVMILNKFIKVKIASDYMYLGHPDFLTLATYRLTVSTATVRIRGKLQEAQGHNSWPSTGTVDTRNAVGHHINNTASNNSNNSLGTVHHQQHQHLGRNHSSEDLRTHKQDASEYLFHRQDPKLLH